MIPGEGAAVLVLEPLERALARGARVYAELAGYGLSCDAHHMTAAHPEGDGAARAMERALADAGAAPEEVGYISAHGTGTPTNDRLETLAVKRVFGEAARRTPMSSIKSMIGHTMGAASAIEAAVCALAVAEDRIPPTMNLEEPEEDLDFVPNTARELPRAAGDEQRLRLRRQQRLRAPAQGGGLSHAAGASSSPEPGPSPPLGGLAGGAARGALRGARAASRPIELFSTEGIGCHQAGEIRPFEPRDYLGERNLRPIDRTSRLLLVAARPGPRRGRLDGGAARRAGGRAGARHHLLQRPHDRRVRPPGPAARAAPTPARSTSPTASSTPPRGRRPSGTACAGSTPRSRPARRRGWRRSATPWTTIRGGRAAALLAGGAEELCFESFLGHYRAGRLCGSRGGGGEVPVPFDARRNGFALAEGAALLMLEDAEAAAGAGRRRARRGARPRRGLRPLRDRGGRSAAPWRGPSASPWTTPGSEPGDLDALSASASGSVDVDRREAAGRRRGPGAARGGPAGDRRQVDARRGDGRLRRLSRRWPCSAPSRTACCPASRGWTSAEAGLPLPAGSRRRRGRSQVRRALVTAARRRRPLPRALVLARRSPEGRLSGEPAPFRRAAPPIWSPASRSRGTRDEAVAARRRWVEERTGGAARARRRLLAPRRGDARQRRESRSAPRRCRSAWPVRCGSRASTPEGTFYVPLATTEGALVRSYERGMVALTRAGGADGPRARGREPGRRRSSVFDGVAEAARFRPRPARAASRR